MRRFPGNNDVRYVWFWHHVHGVLRPVTCGPDVPPYSCVCVAATRHTWRCGEYWAMKLALVVAAGLHRLARCPPANGTGRAAAYRRMCTWQAILRAT